MEIIMMERPLKVDFTGKVVVITGAGAAAGSPICILTVLKTTLAYNNLDVLEVGYGISLRTLEQMADHVYAGNDVSLWRPKDETKGGPTWQVSARMHKAITVCQNVPS